MHYQASLLAKMPLMAQCLMTNLVIKINLAPPRPTEGRGFRTQLRKTMAMVYCRACAKELHETAPSCPQCGASQQAVVPPHAVGTPWLAIVSLVLGILCVLSLFDDSEWDRDTLTGLGAFAVAGLICGIISINKRNPGHNLAIAGVVLSGLAGLVFLGLSID
jgi:hypothetical protein